MSSDRGSSCSAPPSRADDGFADWVRRNVTPYELDGAEPDDIGLLRRFAAAEEHPPGVTLFREGDPVGALYIVEDGYVDVFTERPPERRILRTCGPGCTLGELPVRRQQRLLPYSAATRTTTRTLRLPAQTVEALIEIQPAICLRFLRLVGRCLARTEGRLLELSGRSALERTVQFILRETDEHESATIAVTQDEIAAAVGLSRQTINRVIGKLEAIGLIVRRRKALTILDRQRLEAMANPELVHAARD